MACNHVFNSSYGKRDLFPKKVSHAFHVAEVASFYHQPPLHNSQSTHKLETRKATVSLHNAPR